VCSIITHFYTEKRTSQRDFWDSLIKAKEGAS